MPRYNVRFSKGPATLRCIDDRDCVSMLGLDPWYSGIVMKNSGIQVLPAKDFWAAKDVDSSARIYAVGPSSLSSTLSQSTEGVVSSFSFMQGGTTHLLKNEVPLQHRRGIVPAMLLNSDARIPTVAGSFKMQAPVQLHLLSLGELTSEVRIGDEAPERCAYLNTVTI